MCRRTRRILRSKPNNNVVGVALIRYTGVSTAKENGGYQGDTGKVYNFGMDAPQGLIDKRDLPYFTALTEDGISVFKEVR